MKLVKKFVLVSLFVSALSATTYAGDMETPGLLPPPSSMSSTSSTTDAASNGSTETTEITDTSDILLYDALLTLLGLY